MGGKVSIEKKRRDYVGPATNEWVRYYSALVEFMGLVLGPDYEIALHDVKRRQIIAIANGHVSGRSIGAPPTSLAMQIIAEKSYLSQNWKLNYRGVAEDGKVLRCSTFFIKDEHGELVGLLCINFDDSRYRELSEKVFDLCHPNNYVSRNISIQQAPLPLTLAENGDQETFYNSIAAATDDAFRTVMNTTGISSDRLTQEEKMKIIQLLDERGVFMLKGATQAVAQRLSCSQATMYRYLSKINQEKAARTEPGQSGSPTPNPK